MESITKGVVALLVGIAFDRGWLKDLDASIFSFLPEYGDLRTPDNNQITLHHLLSMTSGLDWPERAMSVNNPENIVRRGTSPLIRIVSCWSVRSSAAGDFVELQWRRRLAALASS
jgi:CubicO group peptidase (beta-lactamase class C family)